MDNMKQKVLEENEKVHDGCAILHTSAVPYQSRPRTRNYILGLIMEQIQAHGINPEGKKFLEVACGTGTFVALAKKLGAKSYDGFDISGEMVRIARENNEDETTKFYKASLEDYAGEHEGTYDVIISSSFLHHLFDLEEGLLQIKSMLAPGGIYIAVHEVDNTRVWTRLEIFDEELSFLAGYQGRFG